jgi:hypothetical protein
MKIFERVMGILIVIGLALSFNLIPGGSILIVFPGMILACLYFYLGFALFNNVSLKGLFKKTTYKELSTKRILGSVGIGTGLSIAIIGIMFKIQHWPSASLFLGTGLVISFIGLIIVTIKFIKTKDKFYLKLISRIAIIGVFGFFLFIIPDIFLVKIKFRNHPEYINAYEKYIQNPQDPELKEKLELEYFKATMSKENFEMYQKQIEENKN